MKKMYTELAYVLGIIILAMKLVGLIPESNFAVRIVFFAIGMMLGAVGVALLFHTYIAPEAYELVVKEVSAKYRWNINRVKTVYDCISCLLAIIMSFSFFGLFVFEGVKVGTVITALVNGSLIGWFSRLFESKFEFVDGLRNRNTNQTDSL